MTNTSLAHVLDAARALHQATPLLSGFAPWPVDIMPAPVAPLHVPAADLVAALGLAAPARCRPFVDAIRAATAHAHWKRTYTEAEVGADFLARYGYFELFGPTGHFHSHQLRGYIAYWGEGLNYDWHHHEAEELYFVLAGSAEFLAEGSAPARLGPGQTRHHAANQPHAMVTHDEPVLTYVLWRGAGMADLPKMGRAA